MTKSMILRVTVASVTMTVVIPDNGDDNDSIGIIGHSDNGNG